MAPRLSCGILILIAAPQFVGCFGSNREPLAEAPSLPVIQGSELQDFVAESELPVLVEFGVDFPCERCRQMKQPVVDLGDEIEGRAKVVRVDFNMNPALVSQYGGTICPTYVFFDGGEAVRTESFPISADLLASHLESMTESPD